jgi:hypothetical protein
MAKLEKELNLCTPTQYLFSMLYELGQVHALL